MNKDEALKLALEALEWSYGGEPMPSKEIEAMDAIRQVLKDQKGNEMANLRQAAEMALKTLEEINEISKPPHGIPLPGEIDGAMDALRQALAKWTPDDTAYRPDGLSQEELIKISSDYLMDGMALMTAGKHVPVDEVIDRGAWSDVENATKWVDDLRGDEPNKDVAEPIGEIVEAHGLIAVSIPEMPPVGTKLYAQPPKRENNEL